MTKHECLVCQETFVDEDKLFKLPCKHLFHIDCILPWIEKHNTCPSCRYELPTDNFGHENQRRQDGNSHNPVLDFLNGNMSGGNNSNGGGSSSGGAANGTSSQAFNSTYHS